jgi:hypothetical protein
VIEYTRVKLEPVGPMVQGPTSDRLPDRSGIYVGQHRRQGDRAQG